MKTILLFGFDSIPATMSVCSALRPFGAEIVHVPRAQYNCTIGALAEQRTDSTAPYIGAPLGGQMLVFCGLEDQLNDLLTALRPTNLACLKAVLTAHNRAWTPVQLYGILEKERRAMTGRK